MDNQTKPRCVRVTADHVLVRIGVTPGARRDTFEGCFEATSNTETKQPREGLAASLRVRAKPENNAANAAVIALTAKQLGLAKSRISLQSGARSRVKTLRIEGDVGDTLARLARHGALPPDAERSDPAR